MTTIVDSTTTFARPRRPRLALTDRLLLAICIGVPLIGLALFFIYPLTTIAIKSLTTADGSLGLANYLAILSSPSIATTTLNSVVLSLATTLICLVLGFAIAFALQRTALRGRGLVAVALALPMLAPSLVQGLGILFILGRNGLVHKWTGLPVDAYGFSGLLLSDVFYALPQAVLILQAALRHSDARYYDAAEIMGASRLRQFLDITLPNARFGLLSAGFVVFTVTITDFGNAAVIGGNFRVLATEIYAQVSGQMNFGMGAVVGMLLLLPTVAAVVIERVAAQRQFGGGSESAIPVEPDSLPIRDIPLGFAVHGCAFAIMAVVITVIFASFVKLWPYNLEMTLKNYDITVAGGYRPLWTTLEVSLGAALCGVILLFLLAFGMKRLPPKLAKIAYLAAVLPVGVPGMVLGLSYVFAFNIGDNLLGLLYGGSLLIALCNFYHYHSQGFLTMITGMRAVPAALEEAVSCLGGGLSSVLKDAVFPFIGATAVSVFFFLFMRSMVTLSAVIFLITPSLSVAAISVMRLDEAGFVSQAAAFSTCIMGTVLASMVVMRLILQRASVPRN
ncbi:MAG: ABC transporter permease subunit [Rhodospirillaceae bacterium]|nr:ABC transporter permease subunit [Rhodospirillaceae bacterium]